MLKIIKTRLERAKEVWPDELPGVLWAYRTTVRTRTGETPFKLAYGSETVIPAKVHMANHRVTMYQDKDNEEQLRLNLDLEFSWMSLFIHIRSLFIYVFLVYFIVLFYCYCGVIMDKVMDLLVFI